MADLQILNDNVRKYCAQYRLFFFTVAVTIVKADLCNASFAAVRIAEADKTALMQCIMCAVRNQRCKLKPGVFDSNNYIQSSITLFFAVQYRLCRAKINVSEHSQ